jgi:Tol biopolymer transport system component
MKIQLISRNKLSLSFILMALVLLLPSLVVAQEKIAFPSNRDGNSEIYVMNNDGTNQTRLTFNQTFDGEPSFDGNGGRIAFTSTRDGNAEIYVMNTDGSNQNRLTNNLGSDAHPAFSWDGSKIAFISDREGKPDIYVMNSDGTNQIQVTDTQYSAFNPSFSPDGNRILFSSYDGNDSEIWLIEANGINPVNLTDNKQDDRIAHFSPDGTRIVYMSDDDPVNHDFDIFIMNADGSNPVNLTRNLSEESNPSFSPDGTAVVFASGSSGNQEIWAMTPGGTGEINLSNNAATDLWPTWGAANVAPVLNNVTISSPINEGDAATLAGEITDPNLGDTFTLSVDWGDGSGYTGEYATGTTSFALTHTYVDDPSSGAPSDDYYVTYSVNDHRLGTDVDTKAVRVNNVNPIVTDVSVSPAPVVLGNEVTLSGNYTDPGFHGSGTDEQLAVIVSWGDGQNKMLMTNGGPGAILETHKYAAAGSYTITVQLTDNDGGFTLSTVNLLVSPPPPPATPTGFRVDSIAMTRLQLVWSDTSNTADGYSIERCSQRGCNNFLEIGRTFPDVRAFLDTQLFSNTQYYYRMRAFNAGGYSAYTDVVSAKTLRK